MHPHLKEVLFTREQIAERVKELAEVVSRDYEKGQSCLRLICLKNYQLMLKLILWMLPVMVMGFHLLEKLEF